MVEEWVSCSSRRSEVRRECISSSSDCRLDLRDAHDYRLHCRVDQPKSLKLGVGWVSLEDLLCESASMVLTLPPSSLIKPGNTTYPLLAVNQNPELMIYSLDYSSQAINLLRVSLTSQSIPSDPPFTNWPKPRVLNRKIRHMTQSIVLVQCGICALLNFRLSSDESLWI